MRKTTVKPKRRSSKPQLEVTKDYDRFQLIVDNRKPHPEKRAKLRRSMQDYGYIPAYPLHVNRLPGGKLAVKDGQGRYLMAKELGEPIYYVVVGGNSDIDVAQLGNTQRVWNVRDFAERYEQKGNPHYKELLEFAAQHGMPLNFCIAILEGHIQAGQAGSAITSYREGRFVVRCRDKADRTARVYVAMTSRYRQLRTRFFLAALHACLAIPGIDEARLLRGAQRCPGKAIKYGSRDGFLTMIEGMYNYGQRHSVPIKVPAEGICRGRNPATLRSAVTTPEA